MIRFYLKLARRALVKYKYHTAINVFGLVCGTLSALIIAKYIGASLQVDQFHVNKDRIYSVSQREVAEGNTQEMRNGTYPGVMELAAQFPEVSEVARYAQHVRALVIHQGRGDNSVSFTESEIFVTDSGFLKIFTFPLIQGNPKTALSRPNSVVLTKATAEKYFGDVDPIGQTLTIRVSWGKETTYQVTGVAEDVPALSRFQFDFLVTQPPANSSDEYWYVPDCLTYLLLKGNAKPAVLAEKLTQRLREVPQLKATNRSVTLALDSIKRSQLSSEDYLLGTVAIFIIVISWVNYINQVIAQAYWRVKQVGIFRIMGATGLTLKMQFFVESVVVCLTSMFFIIGAYLIIEPNLQSFTNGHLLPLTGDPTMINVIFLGIFTIGILAAASLQTAIHFSKNVRMALQNVYTANIGRVGLRKGLVVLQFSISSVLMISIFVISDQLDYLETKDKGINLKDVLIVNAPMVKDTTWYAKRKTLELFKQRCAELPFVIDVTSSTTIPGEAYRRETYLSCKGSTDKALIHQNGVDEHFFSLYEVEFIAGHDFIANANSKNRSSIILNESAARALGISDYDKIINTAIIDHEEPDVSYNVIGVVSDYHKTSMKYEMRPVAFKFNVFRGHCSLKINRAGVTTSRFAQQVDAIKTLWKESYPDASFDHFFLENTFADQDRQDRDFGELFKYFTVLSVIISCLGLFGLSLLISTKRQKEVGIRKTFGASSMAIVVLFLRSYMGPLSIAILVGSPVAYLMMKKWLENYAYRIEIGIGLFALAIGTLAAIFIFTVAYSTIKSSRANPVNVLRE